MVMGSVAAAATRLDEAFNFLRGKVLSLVLGTPRVPIAGPSDRAAGLIPHQFIPFVERSRHWRWQKPL